jgi:hypothetical protein
MQQPAPPASANPIPMEVDDDYNASTNTWRGSSLTASGQRMFDTSPSILPPWHGQAAAASALPFPMVFGTSPNIGQRKQQRKQQRK